MHIQKLLPVICVAALVGSSALNVFAEDNDLQAKAREALRQKMAELDSQNSTKAAAPAAKPTPAPKVAKKATPVAAAPTPAPKRVAQPVVAAPTAQVHTLTPDEFQKLLAAERAESDRLNAQQQAAAKRQTETVKPAVKTTEVPQIKKISSVPATSTMQPTRTAPVSAAATSKEQKLQKLLRDYEADLITPAEYHEQRAKILAE